MKKKTYITEAMIGSVFSLISMYIYTWYSASTVDGKLLVLSGMSGAVVTFFGFASGRKVIDKFSPELKAGKPIITNEIYEEDQKLD